MDLYELQLNVSTADYRFYVDHRFSLYPSPATVKALLAEAKDFFSSLYETPCEYASVALVRLQGDDSIQVNPATSDVA